MTSGAMAGALVFWASAFAAIRSGLGGFNPAALALTRFALASAVLGMITAAHRPRWPGKGDLGRIAAASLLLLAAYNLGLNYGERHIGAGTASLLIATAPLFTAMIAWLLPGERLSLAGSFGIITGFLGAGMIALAGGALSFDHSAPAGLVLGPLEFMTYAVWAATAVMLPAAPAAIADLQNASSSQLAAAVYLGIIPTVLAYILWAAALKRMPTARAASFLYLLPTLAILIALLWLGEFPAPLALCGGVLAIAGVMIANRRAHPPMRQRMRRGAD